MVCSNINVDFEHFGSGKIEMEGVWALIIGCFY